MAVNPPITVQKLFYIKLCKDSNTAQSHCGVLYKKAVKGIAIYFVIFPPSWRAGGKHINLALGKSSINH